MPNLALYLKQEIARISRKEIKSATSSIHASTVSLKKTIADLKKRLAALEADNERLVTIQKKTQPQQPAVSPETTEKVRITAKTIRKLRDKLGLSQGDFGKLIDVSRTNVFNMEHKSGRLRFRGATLGNILAVRGMGKREARKRLEKMENNAVKLKK